MLSIMNNQLFVPAFLVISFLWTAYLIACTLLFSPLAHIPNAHPSSPYSSLWILWKRYKGHELDAVAAAHRRHGPVIRLSPGEISVNTADKSIQRLHLTKVEKSPWYSFFSNYGVTNTMSSLDDRLHSARRKRISHVYSKSWLQSSDHMHHVIARVLHERLLPTVKTEVHAGRSVNILPLCLATGLDMVGAYFFGLDVASDFIRNESDRDDWMEAYARSHSHDLMFWTQEVSPPDSFVDRIGKSIWILPSAIEESTKYLNEWCLGLCDAANSQLVNMDSVGTSPGIYPEVYSHLKTALAKERLSNTTNLSEREERIEIASELLDHLVATRDAFGVTLAKACYELSKAPVKQRLLREELRRLPESLDLGTKGIPSAKELDELPYLNGIIKEALRLRPTYPEGQPRITPPGGVTICDFQIPQGTRINSYPFLLHRIDSTFSHAAEWLPERWTKTEREDQKFDYMAQERNFWAFGRGPRICLGSHLVIQLMQYILAAIYADFETNIQDATEWGKHGGFVSGAPEEALWLRFHSIKQRA